MRTLKVYEIYPYAIEIKAKVLDVFESNGKPCAVLSETILFPEGGGQPGDRGTIGEADVLDVIQANDEILHILDRKIELGKTSVILDWGRRYDNMQQHTGQHLLTAVAQDRFRWATTAFHLGPDLCDIELDTPQISPSMRLELEEAVIEEIIANKKVITTSVSLEEYGNMKVRSRGLPDGHSGSVRLVEIEGLDINTCGGTHLASTSELESIKLLDTESIRGGTRLFFIFGKRVRSRLEAHEKRLQQLRTFLGRPDDGLVDAVEQRISHEKELERSLRHADDELATVYAKLLKDKQSVLLSEHFENKDSTFLQKLARQILESTNDRLLFITAEKDGNYFFNLCATPISQADIPKLGREVATLLNGRGGGSGKQFQGKFTEISKLEEAREMIMHQIIF
ncbi:MAG: DHHA1 domain-containing protein [Holophagaceae bacterium]|nr:DHHA1 domain-containing protein [Holophagaceae bacterium]